MNELAKHIQSFVTLRGVILRALKGAEMSKNEIMYAADLSEMKYANRMAMPETWTVDEIESLAKYLKRSFSNGQTIRQLAAYLCCLPKEYQRKVLQNAQIDRKKLMIRRRDYNRWKPDELKRIALALEEVEIAFVRHIS